jgi:hypothetical protein
MEPTPKKRLATVGVSALLLAGGATAGAVLGAPIVSDAQSTTTTTPSQDATGPDESTTTGTPPTDADREAAHEEYLRSTLQPLVDDGTITADQLDAVVDALEAAGPPMGGHGFGHGPGRGANLDAAAEAIGITTDELGQALRDGSSIADVAAEHGVDVQVVIDAMVADLQDHLADEVASGEHTQEEADAILADATERITAMVNGELPAGPPEGHFGGRPPEAPSDDSGN